MRGVKVKSRQCLYGLALFIFLSMVAFDGYAGLVVIVHAKSPLNRLSSSTIKRIYLNKVKKIPNTKIIPFPIDQSENSSVRREFNRRLIGMSASQLRSYWAKRIFTGKGGPPKAVSNDREVIALVKSNYNVIGYIDSASITSGVKVVYK